MLFSSCRQHIDDLFTDLASPGGHGVSPQTLKIGGRVLKVPLAGKSAKVARFTFDDLCGKPLGPADYLGIATTFHTVFLTDVPKLSLTEIMKNIYAYSEKLDFSNLKDVPWTELFLVGSTLGAQDGPHATMTSA